MRRSGHMTELGLIDTFVVVNVDGDLNYGGMRQRIKHALIDRRTLQEFMALVPVDLRCEAHEGARIRLERRYRRVSMQPCTRSRVSYQGQRPTRSSTCTSDDIAQGHEKEGHTNTWIVLFDSLISVASEARIGPLSMMRMFWNSRGCGLSKWWISTSGKGFRANRMDMLKIDAPHASQYCGVS